MQEAGAGKADSCAGAGYMTAPLPPDLAMPTTPPTPDLELRRKRLLYRSVYRGNRENDILLGQFAQAHIGGFGAAELDQWERLLQVPDNDIFDWISGMAPVPADQDTPVLLLLKAFRVRFER
jgi:antitoxin CptB